MTGQTNGQRFPLVSIITLNYNQEKTTIEFLESSRRLSYPNYEILVCDMGSIQSPENAIAAGNFPKTRLLHAGENLGFAAGNNWGIRQAKGEFLFIVNNDTVLNSSIIERLLGPFDNDPTLAVTCPKIKFFHDPARIEYAGFNKMHSLTGRTSAIGYREEDNGQFDEPSYTEGAHGAAMMIRKAVLNATGMFPEKFFLYYEEWDLSARIKAAGFRIRYSPEAEILHKGSQTVGEQSEIREYYLTRNRILYMRRNSNFLQLLIFTSFFVIFTIPKTLILYFARQQFSRMRYFLRGIAWNLYSSSNSPV